MSRSLQEYVDSGGLALRVDAAAGVLAGVKILGLASRNGRSYRPQALAAAAPLYEGAKVNVNHPKGHPTAPRDYQDRIGVVRRVVFRPDTGLFADFHFNPRHALAEQLVWDARHAPQNVGFSHNVEARTTRSGGQMIVEAITRVLGVDLVADPATTRGLFEGRPEVLGDRLDKRLEAGGDRLEEDDARDSQASNLTPHASTLTLEELREARPDLVEAIRSEQADELAALREEVDRLQAAESVAHRKALIERLLQEHDLPRPAPPGHSPGAVVSESFYRNLLAADDEAAVRRLIEERAALVESARRDAPATRPGRPQSRMQPPPGFTPDARKPATARDFAQAITR